MAPRLRASRLYLHWLKTVCQFWEKTIVTHFMWVISVCQQLKLPSKKHIFTLWEVEKKAARVSEVKEVNRLPASTSQWCQSTSDTALETCGKLHLKRHSGSQEAFQVYEYNTEIDYKEQSSAKILTGIVTVLRLLQIYLMVSFVLFVPMLWLRCLPRGPQKEAGENIFENTTSELAEQTLWKEATCQKIVVKGVIKYVELITLALDYLYGWV